MSGSVGASALKRPTIRRKAASNQTSHLKQASGTTILQCNVWQFAHGHFAIADLAFPIDLGIYSVDAALVSASMRVTAPKLFGSLLFNHCAAFAKFDLDNEATLFLATREM